MQRLNDDDAEAVRLLNRNGVPVIAWLQLPPDEGLWFNLQNYPQAIERYRAFRAWARRNELNYDAVGLDIEPPIDGDAQRSRRGQLGMVRVDRGQRLGDGQPCQARVGAGHVVPR